MKFAAVPNKNPALVNLVSSGDFWGLTEKEKKYYHECKLVHGIGPLLTLEHRVVDETISLVNAPAQVNVEEELDFLRVLIVG